MSLWLCVANLEALQHVRQNLTTHLTWHCNKKYTDFGTILYANLDSFWRPFLWLINVIVGEMQLSRLHSYTCALLKPNKHVFVVLRGHPACVTRRSTRFKDSSWRTVLKNIAFLLIYTEILPKYSMPFLWLIILIVREMQLSRLHSYTYAIQKSNKHVFVALRGQPGSITTRSTKFNHSSYLTL